MRTLDEGPQVRQDVARDAATLVADADDDVLGRLADGDFNWRKLAACRGLPEAQLLLDDALYAVAQQLADDVFHVGEDEREVGVEVAGQLDLREGDVVAVGGAGEGEDGAAAALDYVGGVAFEKDFADELGVGGGYCWGVCGRVESLGEGEMLLCYHAPRDSLCELVSKEGGWCIHGGCFFSSSSHLYKRKRAAYGS